MKKVYEEMKVELVGAVSNIVNKSGTFSDSSQQFESKGPDSGPGNGGKR